MPDALRADAAENVAALIASCGPALDELSDVQRRLRNRTLRCESVVKGVRDEPPERVLPAVLELLKRVWSRRREIERLLDKLSSRTKLVDAEAINAEIAAHRAGIAARLGRVQFTAGQVERCAERIRQVVERIGATKRKTAAEIELVGGGRSADRLVREAADEGRPPKERKLTEEYGFTKEGAASARRALTRVARKTSGLKIETGLSLNELIASHEALAGAAEDIRSLDAEESVAIAVGAAARSHLRSRAGYADDPRVRRGIEKRRS